MNYEKFVNKTKPYKQNNMYDYWLFFFRAKRRERDNARKAQSRRWYYEKADWIVSDEIEDDELDLSEEEVILEQSLEVPTVKVDRVLRVTAKQNF